MSERILRNSGLPPKFLLSPTEQTGRDFSASRNRGCADNPKAPGPVTAALSDPSPVRSFWETWDQSPKSKFIPPSLKRLHRFELQSQEAKGNNGKFLLSHVLTFFQRQEVIVALLWELFPHQRPSQMPQPPFPGLPFQGFSSAPGIATGE